jgi:hypothetical protein
MAEVRMPLSGDVAQTINPWTWWIRAFGQFGFININETNTGDAATEQRIVQEVASYGRQLGWISEALAIVLRHTKYGDLSAVEQRSLKQFADMMAQIRAIKDGEQGAATQVQIDRLVQAVEDLKRTDRTVFDALAPRLLQAMGSAAPAPAKQISAAASAPPTSRASSSPSRKRQRRR